MRALVARARQRRWCHLGVVNLRILLGFAFVPAGLKKVLDEPFTDPQNVGRFHDFLHAFHATGWFYQFVGVVQLTIAVLLMTQHFATLGAGMAVPVFTAITAFCWSTATVFTATMATLMLAASLALMAWDFDAWSGVVGAPRGRADQATEPVWVDLRLWRNCGLAILVFYLAVCVVSGGIYRPVGIEFDQPGFYVFPVIAMFPLVTFALAWRRSRRRRRSRRCAASPS